MHNSIKLSHTYTKFAKAVALRSSVIVSAFLVFLLSSYLYGPEGRGIISLLTAFYLALSLFLSFGLGRVSYQNISKEPLSAKPHVVSIIRYVFFISLLILLLLGVALAVSGKHFEDQFKFSRWYLFLFLGSFPYYLWLNFSNYLFAATQTTESHDKAIFIHRLFLVLILTLVAIAHLSLSLFLAIYGCVCFGIFILESNMLIKSSQGSSPGLKQSYQLTKDLFYEAKWPYIDSIAQSSAPVGAFLLGLFISKEDLGNYNFAVQIMATLNFPFGISQVKLQEIFAKDLGASSSLIKKIFLVVIPASIFLCVISYVIPPIIPMVGLSSFHEAVPLLKSLLPTLPLSAALCIFQSIWVGRHRSRLSSILNLSTMIINTLVILFLVTRFQAYAGVYATYISSIYCLVLNFYVLKTR